MIDVLVENLQKGIRLLETISDEEYSNCTVAPYYSSIGNNMRHVLDVYACIYKGLEKDNIDFSKRERNELAQQKTADGVLYFKKVIKKLQEIDISRFDDVVNVTDDLGGGKVCVKYTLGSALAQAHSHAIHHYAIVGFIVNALGVTLQEEDFGYNPTTPKKVGV